MDVRSGRAPSCWQASQLLSRGQGDTADRGHGGRRLRPFKTGARCAPPTLRVLVASLFSEPQRVRAWRDWRKRGRDSTTDLSSPGKTSEVNGYLKLRLQPPDRWQVVSGRPQQPHGQRATAGRRSLRPRAVMICAEGAFRADDGLPRPRDAGSVAEVLLQERERARPGEAVGLGVMGGAVHGDREVKQVTGSGIEVKRA